MKIRDRIKELRRVRATELRPNPRNWRMHPQKQQDALRGILAEVGYADAVLARELEDGSLELIDGHLRAETSANAEIPVLVLDVDEAEADKLLLSIDPLAAMAEPDAGKLSALISEVEFANPALEKMVSELAASAYGKLPTKLRPDEVPAQPDEAITKRGDVWVLGKHRLMCGDSSIDEDVDCLLEGKPVQLVNTDPPYNVKVEPRSANAIAAGLSSFGRSEQARPTDKKLRAKDRPLANDFVSAEKFDHLLRAWFGQIGRVLEPGRSFYIWGGYGNCGNYPPALAANELYFSQAIIWVKQHPVVTRKDFMGNHEWCFFGSRRRPRPSVFGMIYEWCFYGWRQGAGHEFFGPPNATDVWTVKKVHSTKMVHLTEKPVELAARAIEYSSRPGETVLDLFGGSGSTLIACEQLDRQARLMELDQLYCDVIVDRWEKFTGRKAHREGEAT